MEYQSLTTVLAYLCLKLNKTIPDDSACVMAVVDTVRDEAEDDVDVVDAAGSCHRAMASSLSGGMRFNKSESRFVMVASGGNKATTSYCTLRDDAAAAVVAGASTRDLMESACNTCLSRMVLNTTTLSKHVRSSD